MLATSVFAAFMSMFMAHSVPASSAASQHGVSALSARPRPAFVPRTTLSARPRPAFVTLTTLSARPRPAFVAP